MEQYEKISAIELATMTNLAVNEKVQALIKKYYNEIIVVAKSGKWRCVAIFEGNGMGDFTPEEYATIETLKECFPGIDVSYRKYSYIVVFSWE